MKKSLFIALFLTTSFVFSQNKFFYGYGSSAHTNYNISHQGNISIGTTTALSKFHVNNGAIRITGGSPNFAGPALLFGESGHATNEYGKFFMEYVEDKGLNFGIPWPASGFGSNILFISNTKKVGIGTDNFSCSDYKFFVKSGIKTEKIKVEIASANGWADYVFEKNYKLMSLGDLEKYIIKNKHLPEVPTTKEAIANGIELKAMNILLLKKVEELTLYLIEQNKKIEKLEQLINLTDKYRYFFKRHILYLDGENI